MNDLNDLSDEQSEPPISLGQLLATARVERQLSADDIANILCLSPRVIVAIDNDQLDPKLSLLYRKGYVKAYAKIVGIEQVQALAKFDSQYQSECSSEKMQSFSHRYKAKIYDNYLNIITILIMLSFLVMIVIWWLQRQEQVQMAETASPPIIAQMSLNSAELQAIVPALTPVLQTSQVQFNAASVHSESASEQMTQQIVLSFSDDCWVKLIDASNEVLVSGIKKAGQTVTVSGIAPFDVTLGAASAVSILYQGEPFDISPFITGKTAQFNVRVE